jgi:hypothetical protein
MGTASAAGAAQEAVAGAARNRTYPGARRGGPKSFVTLTGDRGFESCSLQQQRYSGFGTRGTRLLARTGRWNLGCVLLI